LKHSTSSRETLSFKNVVRCMIKNERAPIHHVVRAVPPQRR
jgi:hypothetical protein